MATGMHTVIHLSDNRLWSTLKTIPNTHDEVLAQCKKHLVYLRLGVFLQLKERPTCNILGTLSGQDPETHRLLLEQITHKIKHEETDIRPEYKPTWRQATAAAGSASQLSRVEKELNSNIKLPGTTGMCTLPTGKTHPSKPTKSVDLLERHPPTSKPLVNIMPFEVRLVKLSQQEISKHTRKHRLCKTPTLPSNRDRSDSPYTR